MATLGDAPKGEHGYFNDPDSGGEIARLISQDRLITRSGPRPMKAFAVMPPPSSNCSSLLSSGWESPRRRK